MINLTLFYNIFGILISILSITMFLLPSQTEERAFNLSKRNLAIGILLTGISMFVAQFEEQLEKQQFEKLNALMLLFFFLIGQGIMFSILVLYSSRYADKQHLKRALLPVLPWFALYTLIYFFTGDIRVHSFREFFLLIPQEPLLILRCVILTSMFISIIYTLNLCHKAKSEYNTLILSYFSETGFSRSIWLSNLLGYAEALSLWVFLTYFYTTPILEVIVGILITIFFTLYVKEFHYYSKRYPLLQPAILLEELNKTCTLQTQVSPMLQSDATSTALKTEYFEVENSTIIEVAKIETYESTSEDSNYANDNKQQDEKAILSADDNEAFYGICANLLNTWVERSDKPYMKPGLTIGDVASEIDIPKYRLSNYINRKQVNFNTWIKELRIEEASRLLIASPEISASAIAKKCGFCDLPAFSHAFKKIKGVSPTEYRSINLPQTHPEDDTITGASHS